MLRGAAGKVMWVGRATVFLVGLAVILALVFGAASTALGANGQAWILGQTNVATAITRLAGPEGVQGAMMQVVNNDAGTDDTALALNVQSGEAPMRVNSATKVANLNADKLDGLDSAGFLSSERIYVVTQNFNPGPNALTYAGVSCDGEDVAISGGFGGVETTTHVISSSPAISVEYQWRVDTRTSSTAGDSYFGYVKCADLPPLRP